ncbi:MAG: protein phosphatase 2C domain-containing protein [Ruminococcaceae bacterium]|nr:protein phosphatase 2C domain-containing protein [Oscillospiraceae bacterium]
MKEYMEKEEKKLNEEIPVGNENKADFLGFSKLSDLGAESPDGCDGIIGTEWDEIAEDDDLPPSPPLEKEFYGIDSGIAYFGYSAVGRSHIASGTPCQDRCCYRKAGNSPYSILAMADGLGSCAFSDIGAYVAVNSAADLLMKGLSSQSEPLSKDDIHKLLYSAMEAAYDNVEKSANDSQQLLYSYQSTLTLGVYDGTDLYYAHVGDGGIIALDSARQLKMITKRHKGKERHSVYPLQSKDTWEFGFAKDICAFFMATDGVLDYVVSDPSDGEKIYYPFLSAIFTRSINCEEDAHELCRELRQLTKSDEFGKNVIDDITVMCAINTKNAINAFPDDCSQGQCKEQGIYLGRATKTDISKDRTKETNKKTNKKANKKTNKDSLIKRLLRLLPWAVIAVAMAVCIILKGHIK